MYIQSVRSFNSFKGSPLQKVMPMAADAAQAATHRAAEDLRIQQLYTKVISAAAKNGYKNLEIMQIKPDMLSSESDRIALHNVQYALRSFK